MILLISMSWYLDFPDILPLRPQSVHAWRQTDCLSFARNYHDRGMDFFQPEIHNQLSDEHTSGKTAWEFPLLYWLVAGIWKLTGVQEWIFRLLVFVIFSWGLYAIFRLIDHLTKQTAGALFSSLLLLASPVLAYYSLNFLPNVPSLGLLLLSWYLFFLYLEKPLWWRLAGWITAASLAALLKVTALISLTALGGLVLLNIYFGWSKRIKEQALPILAGIVITGTLASAWFLYAVKYNAHHWGEYGLIRDWTLWNLDPERTGSILHQVRNLWLPEYHHPWVLVFSGAGALWLLLTPRRSGWLLWCFFLLVLVCSIFYILLFFNAFYDHDYYTINLYILFPLIWGMLLFQAGRSSRITAWSVQGTMLALLVVSVVYTAGKLDERYNGWWNYDHRKNFSVYENIEPLNRSLSIRPEDKIISVADPSFNITLYLMNQRGWTNYRNPFESGDEVEYFIDKGARYLFINEFTLGNDRVFMPYIADTLATVPPVSIYRLKTPLK